MATNVGTVFVTVRASTKGLAGQIRRDLVRDLSDAGRESGAGFVRNFRDSVAGKDLGLGGLRDAAGRAGRSGGKRAGDQFADNFLSRVLLPFATLGFLANRGGRRAGRGFGDGFNSGLGQVRLSVGPFSFPLGDFNTALARVIGTMVALGNAIVGVAAEALALVGALGSAASASAAFLPILGAIGQGAGVLAIGFQGLKKAITEGGEELDKLGPAAREVAVAVQGLSFQWGKLTLAVQDTLFEGVADSLRLLGNTLFPVLQARLSETGTVLSNFFNNFAQSATSARNVKDLNTVLGSQNRILGTLLTAAGSLGAAFRDFYVTVLPFAERLADAIRRGSARLAELAAEGRRSGELAEFFERAYNNASLLLQGLRDVTVGLVNFFDVGEDRGTVLLEKFAELAAEFRDFASSAEGQDSFREFFEFGALVSERLKEIFVALSPAVTAVVEGISRYLGATSSLTPVIGQLSGILASLIEGAVFPLIGLFGQLTEIVARVLGPVLEALAPLFDEIASVVGTLLEALSPLLDTLGDVLVDIVENVVVPALDILVEILIAVLGGFETLEDPIKIIVDILDGALTGAVEGVTGSLGFLGDLLVGDFKSAMAGGSGNLEEFGGVADAVEGSLDILYGRLGAADAPFDQLRGAAQRGVEMLQQTNGGLRNVFDSLQALYLRLGGAPKAVGSLESAGKKGGKALGGLASSAGLVRGAFDRAVDAIRRFNNTPVKNVQLGVGGTGRAFASGGIVAGPTRALVGDSGAEAMVPLNRPLSLVHPSVRELSAIAQGLSGGRGAGRSVTVAPGAITVTANGADPVLVAEAVLDRLVLAVA